MELSSKPNRRLEGFEVPTCSHLLWPLVESRNRKEGAGQGRMGWGTKSGLGHCESPHPKICACDMRKLFPFWSRSYRYAGTDLQGHNAKSCQPTLACGEMQYERQRYSKAHDEVSPPVSSLLKIEDREKRCEIRPGQYEREKER